MKTKITLLLAVFALTLSSKAVAQDDPCVTTASLFIEPAKAKNYEAALPHYEKLVNDCPKYSVATYQLGERMFEYFVKNGNTDMLSKLQQNYVKQATFFPKKAKIGKGMAKVAQLKYDSKIGTMEEQFADFDAAFKKDEKTFTSPKGLYTYFSLGVDLFNAGKKDIQEVFDLYDVMQEKLDKEGVKYASRVTTLVDKEEAGAVLTSKEKKKLAGYEKTLVSYGKVRGSVDGKLGQLADCPNLIPLYEKNFEEKKNDVQWLKSAAGKLNAKDCDTPLFYKMVQQLHSIKPSAASAFYLGRLAAKDGKSSEALKYYEQAVSLEENPNQKVKYYNSIAENFRKKGSYGKARTYYNKVLQIKPNAGRAYLKIAQMYAKSSSNCGSTPFEKRAMNWKAAQMADKAARVDPSIASTAKAAASSYRQRAPSKTDIFNSGMAGKTISFNCWVGGSVRVPNL